MPRKYERIILDEDHMLEITRHDFSICAYVYDESADDYEEDIHAGSVTLSDKAMLKLFAVVAQLIIQSKLNINFGDACRPPGAAGSHQPKEVNHNVP